MNVCTFTSGREKRQTSDRRARYLRNYGVDEGVHVSIDEKERLGVINKLQYSKFQFNIKLQNLGKRWRGN